MMNLGSLVSGVVEQVTPHAVVVCVNSKSHIKGTISPEHLSDHLGVYFLFLDFFSRCTCSSIFSFPVTFFFWWLSYMIVFLPYRAWCIAEISSETWTPV